MAGLLPHKSSSLFFHGLELCSFKSFSSDKSLDPEVHVHKNSATSIMEAEKYDELTNDLSGSTVRQLSWSKNRLRTGEWRV